MYDLPAKRRVQRRQEVSACSFYIRRQKHLITKYKTKIDHMNLKIRVATYRKRNAFNTPNRFQISESVIQKNHRFR